MRHILIGSLLALALASGTAGAAPAEAGSAASQASANLSAVVVGGSLLSVAASGRVIVASARTVGDVLELVLESAVDASRVTLRLSASAAGGLSIATGTVLEVLTASTGQVLVLAGRAIAFLPNEAGKALLHHTRAI